MKNQFTIEPLKFSTLQELPNAWSETSYKELLEKMDFDGVSEIAPNELKEMCLMALTDNEPEDAVKIVLEYVFKDRLTEGQIDNLSNEMLEEKLWEEYADLSMHEDFFNTAQLLYEAFTRRFPKPEAVRFQVKVTAINQKAMSIFEQNTEAPLIRLFVQGMPQNTLINRLFDEQLEGEFFPESKDIIWQLKKEPIEGNTVTFDIVSSMYWFKDFKFVEAFDASLDMEV